MLIINKTVNTISLTLLVLSFVSFSACFLVIGSFANSGSFEVKVGMHQGSALSPLLFVIVMEAISREFRVALPWDLLYADDFIVIAETEEDLIKRLNEWKNNVENRGMRVNMNKTKVMISGERQKPARKTARWPCGICGRGVGSNSIQCTSCLKWVHKKCISSLI